MTKPIDIAFLTLPEVPEQVKPLMRKLLAEPLVSPTAMRSLVETYIRVIRKAARDGLPVNLTVGEGIAMALLAFLPRIDERTSEQDHHIVQATVRYFVIENDSMGHDLAHEDGLFDDARVVNAMLRWFGRDDLKVRLPTPAAARRAPTSTAIPTIR